MKVEVAALGFPSVIVVMVSVDVKRHELNCIQPLLSLGSVPIMYNTKVWEYVYQCAKLYAFSTSQNNVLFFLSFFLLPFLML